MKKVEAQHIKALFEFTEKHYVEWHDLQVELVDHLASDIEAIWQTNPDLSFEEAKQQSFAKFGIFGFGDIVEQKQTFLNKKYYALMWQNLADIFRSQLVFVPLAMFMLLSLVLNMQVYTRGVIVVFIALSFTYGTYRLIKVNASIKKRRKKSGKKYLSDKVLLNFTNYGFGCWYPLCILLARDSLVNLSPLQNGLLALWLVFVILYLYIGLIKAPKQINDYMRNTVPGYV